MASSPTDVVIAAAVRTPTGKFLGSLKGFRAPELGSLVIREVLQRANLDPADVDEVIMGNVLQAGLGQAPARQAALGAGLPPSVSAVTVNKVCGSSLKAVMLATQALKAGDADVIVAGGMESMTNAPHLLLKARTGYRLGNGELVDAMIHDGLLDVYNKYHMGVTGEVVAEEFGITRKEADEFAVESHRKAQHASEQGWFKDEIVPVEVREKKGAEPRLFDHDEGIRAGTDAETLARLKTVFKENGIVTAGNASQISDGAAAVVVTRREVAEAKGLPVMAKVVGYGTSGVEPERVMAAPIPGVKALLDKAGLTVADVDLFEHNEAFATASCAVRAQCAVPADRFNKFGGAVALGHPIGASGARILTTLLYGLKRENKTRGLATLCLGGGNAVQMIVERE